MTTKPGTPIPARTSRLVVATGARGIGKSTFAATFNDPDDLGKVVYMDSEKSANRFREMLAKKNLPDFGEYVDLEDVQRRFKDFPSDDDLLNRIADQKTPWMTAGEQGAMLDYYIYILKTLNQIPDNKYDVLVLDTTEKLELGMRAWCDANRKKFGIEKDHGKMENGLFRPLYENLLNAIWGRGISTIILTFHLRNVWDKTSGKPVPNKVQMAGNIVLYKRANLMVWLVADPRNATGAPAGLVIKERMADIGAVGAVGSRKWNIQRVIPQRIPVCTWDEIRRYEVEGYDAANPKPGEVMSEDERDLISEFYNDKQMELMLKDMEITEKQSMLAMAESGLLPSLMNEAPVTIAADTSHYPRTRADAIAKWKEAGKSVPALLKKLNELGISDEQIPEHWQKMVMEA